MVFGPAVARIRLHRMGTVAPPTLAAVLRPRTPRAVSRMLKRGATRATPGVMPRVVTLQWVAHPQRVAHRRPVAINPRQPVAKQQRVAHSRRVAHSQRVVWGTRVAQGPPLEVPQPEEERRTAEPPQPAALGKSAAVQQRAAGLRVEPVARKPLAEVRLLAARQELAAGHACRTTRARQPRPTPGIFTPTAWRVLINSVPAFAWHP